MGVYCCKGEADQSDMKVTNPEHDKKPIDKTTRKVSKVISVV